MVRPPKGPQVQSFFFRLSCAWVFGAHQEGKAGPCRRSQASGMPLEFQPHAVGQSHFQERAQCMDFFPGEAVNRNFQLSSAGASRMLVSG